MAGTTIDSALTVDVEGRRDQRRYDTIDHLDAFLETVGPPSTLFVTPDVVENREETVKGWKDAGHELGLHVHPERHADGHSNYLSDHSPDEIRRIIESGIETFEHFLGTVPVAFRAGRWSYSPELLSVLDTVGIDTDSSLRPETEMLPYEGFGVREVPLTVYSNQLLRPFLGQFDVNIVPFAIDATLRNRWRELLFHLLTNYMLANDREYIMLGFHDYDLLGAGLFSRLTRYIRLLRIKTCPTMVTNL